MTTFLTCFAEIQTQLTFPKEFYIMNIGVGEIIFKFKGVGVAEKGGGREVTVEFKNYWRLFSKWGQFFDLPSHFSLFFS